MISADNITALILAAGESRRMGTPKPLLPLGDQTVLEKSINLFTNAGIQDIRVITGHLADRIRDRFPNLPVTWIHNDAYKQGMLSSIKKGAVSIGDDRPWFFLLPVDIPLVRLRTLAAILKALETLNKDIAILHPTFMGRRGHPPLISTRLIPDILTWTGPGGLGGFLDFHHADAKEVPVVDEFIGRDMDTPTDFEALSVALSRQQIPTSLECEAMLSDASLFAETTASHCRQVARLAVFFGEALALCGLPLDIERIGAGALLHDIAKGEKNHAAAGAALLREMGYSGITDIVAAHVDMEVSVESPLSESEVVHLADKLVKGDSLVPLAVRFEHKLAKYSHDPSARGAILKRRALAEAIVRRMEHATGRSFRAIMEDFSQDTP